MKLVICGSMRNRDIMLGLFEYYRGPPHFAEVTSPLQVPFEGTKDPKEKAANRRYFFKAVSKADKLLVINRDHVGIGTCMEIGLACALGTCIEFTNDPKLERNQLEFEGLILDREAWVTKETEVVLLIEKLRPIGLP